MLRCLFLPLSILALAVCMSGQFESRAWAAVEEDLPPARTEIPKSERSSEGLRSSARKGTYALIEWNPADLFFDRLRLQGEYVIVDGFAFGGLAEFQKQRTDAYRHSTFAAGINVIQYFESQTLSGPFVRGEMAGIGTVFERKDAAVPFGQDAPVTQEQGVYGLMMGADLGYRFLLSSRVTGGASYGVRRVVPDFFTTQGDSPIEDWKAQNKVWTARVQATLGLAL
jgi:hypothetical protein